MIFKKLTYLLIILLLVNNAIIAQSLKDTTYLLNPVDIKAKKTLKEKGIIKTKIDTTLIIENINASLSDLLSKHSPVFIKSYGQGGLATASFRGTAASHTQVEWNGISLNSPMLGQVDFSLIPLYFIDDIELYHGGSSIQAGSGALGGSVLIASKPKWNSRFKTTLLQSIGSFNTYQSFAKISAGSQKVYFDLRIFHEQSDNDFEFYNNANGLWNYESQSNAKYKKNGALLNTYFRLGKKDVVSFNIWGQLTNRDLPSIMSFQGAGREENQKDEEFRIAGKWNKYGKKVKFEFNSGYSFTSLDYYLLNSTPYGQIYNYNTESEIQSMFNNFNLDLNLSKKTLLRTSLNLNRHEAKILDYKGVLGYFAERIETGASISLHHKFFDNLSAFCLIRKDIIDTTFTPLMPSLGVEYKPFKTKLFFVKSNFTRNYHQPTLNDLYWIPGGNPNLRPEEGYSGDFAIEYKYFKDTSLAVATSIGAYASYINDWIIWRPSDFRYWMADNVKKVFARGIETLISVSGNNDELSWGVFVNYTFTKTTNEEETLVGDNSVGKQLIYIPKHKANALMKMEVNNFVFNYNIAITGERYTTSSNEVTRHILPEYSLHDLQFGKKLKIFGKSAELQIQVNNLLNMDYQAILWRAMPGRNYKLLFKLNI